MERQFASAQLKTDQPARSLVQHLTEREAKLELQDSIVYYDFPLFRDDVNTLYRSNILLASPNHGVLLFQTSALGDQIEDRENIDDLDENLAQLYSLVLSKLLKSRTLRKSRNELGIPINAFLLLPEVVDHSQLENSEFENPIIFAYNDLDREIEGSRTDRISETVWMEVRSTLEGAKGIIRPRSRSIPDGQENGKAAILSRLEDEVVNFDREQRMAAISILEGPQRIRGLAGSGKTVVLAMKAAHIHLRDPDAEILITFYTKSLYDFIKHLITRFYRQFNDFDPDWDKIHILHAWGGKNLPGVYSVACEEFGVLPIPFKDARNKKLGPFGYVCKQLLDTGNIKSKYDYVLIDEAQDFPSQFFRLCFFLAKGGDKDRNVIWAYDELQSITDVTVTSPRESFGLGNDGQPLMDLDRATQTSGAGFDHDVVLHKCYRNAREILITAHALGFGIYSENIVQMLEDKNHWEDVGYVVEEGECVNGHQVSILRPEENSPLSLADMEPPEEIVQMYSAVEFEDEIEWIVAGIKSFLEDGLTPEDILVIALDDRNARSYFVNLASRLAELDVRTNNLLTNPYDYPTFVEEGAITLSTVYRAKGNEAPVVFATGIEALTATRGHQRTRNKIFTAFTRAKAWLRVSGLATSQPFKEEIRTAMQNSPYLRFRYPDVQHIHMIQRDLKDKTQRLRRLSDQLKREVEDMGLDPEEQLELILGTKEKK